ncbi:MAG: single-stranded-DNA-specific exonuclease RecJ [Methanobacteriaceae archaeon]|nr:single-stranded-DNA-specific exonuclease RecJ [Methanobacteriaceae archaeon]
MSRCLPGPMEKAFNRANEMVINSEDIKIYTHIDCDGISAGAILSSMLDRLEKDHEIEFITLDQIPDIEIDNELSIFSDLASGQDLDKNIENMSTSSSKILILDHHPPFRKLGYNPALKGEFLEINPHHYGIDGSFHISGGGMSYLLAKTFGFKDLSWIGVLSAVGDMQNNLSGKLTGINKYILNDAVEEGLISSVNDLSIYGRQTRPIFVALSYFGDVNLPITNNKTECILMLKNLGIPRKNGRKTRCLCDLTQEEKTSIFSELMRMLSREVPSKYVKYIPRLITGESYDFLAERKYTPLRDASEFSTAVNACSRNKNPEVALKVLKGDRGIVLDAMKDLSHEHRRYLAERIEWVEGDDRIIHLKNLQYFNGNGIKQEVVGTIAGMILSHGDWKKPIIGFTDIGDDKNGVKVSLRCSRLLAYDGINFGNIIKKVAKKVGGTGGGHSVACGAYIPEDKTNEFLKLFDESLNGRLA